MRADIEARVADRLTVEEGWRPDVYKDHLGKLTIGYGTLLPLTEKEREMLAYIGDRFVPVPPDQALHLSKREGWALLMSRLKPIVEELEKFARSKGIEIAHLREGAQEALADVAYNIGVRGSRSSTGCGRR